MDPEATAAIALRELRHFSDRVGECAPDDFDRSTALPSWTVDDLVRHVTVTVARQAEAYHRVRFGIADAPADASVTVERAQVPGALAAAAEHVAAGVAAVGNDDVVVPLPFAALPPPVAAFVLLVEYGVHRYDLDLALDGTATLAPDVGELMSDLVGLTLPALAASAPPAFEGIAFEPAGRSPTTLAWRDGAWHSAGGDGQAPCVVRGPADAMALFMMGRIDAGDDRLEVVDPDGVLAGFKAVFPGP